MLVIIEKHIYAKTISALSTFNCHELQVVGYLQFDQRKYNFRFVPSGITFRLLSEAAQPICHFA